MAIGLADNPVCLLSHQHTFLIAWAAAEAKCGVRQIGTICQTIPGTIVPHHVMTWEDRAWGTE